MRSLPLAAALVSLALALGCGDAALEPYGTCASDADGSGAEVPLGFAAELIVPNVDLGVEWYRDRAGFSLLFNAADEQSCFAELELEGGRLLLTHSGRTFDPPDNSIELRFVVEDVDAVYARLVDEGVGLVRDIADQEYGLRDFIVRDVYGFRVRFASTL